MALAAALWLNGCTCAPPPAPAPALPSPTSISAQTSVLYIMVDTLRADRMSGYGYGIETSPELDAVMASGTRFDQAISSASWTRPSMGTLFTGHLPRTLGIYEEEFDALDPSFDTLAELLAPTGRRTLGVTSNPNLNHVFGFDQGYQHYAEAGVVFAWMKAKKTPDQEVFSSKGHTLESGDQITDKTLDLLDHAALKAGEPYFLSVIYIDPHWPYAPPEADKAAMVAAGSDHAGYDGGVRAADREIGRLLEGMRERGLLNDTLIVFTSDHGEGLYDHPAVPESRWHGNILYDSNVHVPLAFSHPSLPAGQVVPELVGGIDVVPTILDLLSLPVPAALPGASLKPYLTGVGVKPAERAVLTETDFRQNRKAALRTNEGLFVDNIDVKRFSEEGLFEGKALKGAVREHLSTMPLVEYYPVASFPPNRVNATTDGPTVEALAKQLAELLAALPERAPLNHSPRDVITLPDGSHVSVSEGAAEELDPATRDALEALGYLEGAP